MAGVVTLFGGAGFLGRYVAQELLRDGARLRIVSRNPRAAWFLKPLGGLGQIEFVAGDIDRERSVERAVAGARAVVNLVGILAGNFRRIHVEGAATVAGAAAAAGVPALVHVSAIGADPASPSAYGRSKGEGEAAVRAAFPRASIVRPSTVFGPEDGFVNRFAQMAASFPVLPVMRGEAKFQPVWVKDVARAIAAAAIDPDRYGGRTFELGGPEVMTMATLNRWITEAIGRDRPILELPDAIGDLVSRLGFLPGAPITRDQWLMLQRDAIVSPGAEGFAAFGIEPAPLAAVAPQYLVRYRRHGRFAKDLTAA